MQLFQHASGLLALGSAVLFLGSTGYAQVQATDLQLFTHTALIPAGSDLSSIRLQGVKVVMLPTRALTDARYCKDAAFTDPGGSMYCPLVWQEHPTPAYQVTYAYEGRPLASDEFAGRHFTFSVYFRPGELGGAVLEGKRRATEMAGAFRWTTSRDFQAQPAIDQENSTFCTGSYVDGAWARSDSNCDAHIHTKTIQIPSDYITVKVDRAP